ncbi:MAG TPA: hypothetical protein DD979_04350 [Gammaproteobacteria bacterium]|jgi:hypothetical protein|nr:hypothetical protein [Gammaproteobacteria bacterium]
MNTLDKSSQQLINSIRKTKAGPDTAAVVAATRQASKTTASPRKKTRTLRSASSTQPKTGTSQAHLIGANPYPDGSQVWPD